MELTKREKILIFMLAVIVVIGIPSYFLIYPQYKAYEASRDKLTQLTGEKERTDETIAEMNENLQQITALKKEAEELYQLMGLTKSYDISLLLSEMLNRHQLTPTILHISPYVSLQEDEQPIPNTEDLINSLESVLNPEAAEEAAPEKDQYAFKRTADLYFTGQDVNAENFLDEITNYNKSVIVDGFTITGSGNSKLYEIRIDFYEFHQPQLNFDAAASPTEEGGND